MCALPHALNQFITLAVYMVHFLRFGWMGLVLLFALSSKSTAQSSNPVGNAFQNGENCYTITPNAAWQLGAVWFNEQISFAESFEITLTVGLGSNPSGADGIVMVFQQVGTNAIGEAGGGLGFNGFFPSLGIEIDTFTNLDFGDPATDHIAILRDGNTFHTNAFNLAGPVNAIASGATMSDGQDHIFQVTWNAQTTTLHVFIDCQLRLTYTGSIVQDIFNGNPFVYWGFTGATGGMTNLQTACIDTFADGLPSEIDLCAGESVQLGVVGSPAGTYAWEPADFLDDPSSPTPTATPDNDVVYTVTYTDLCGNPSTQTTTLNVTEVDLSVVPSSSICEGETAVVTASGNGANYQWSDGQTGSSASFDTAGNYGVTASIGDCSAQVEIEVVMHPNPSASLEEEYTYCEEESAEITIAPTNTSDANWSNGQSGFSAEYTTPGEESVVLINEFGCTTTYVFTVSETPMPTAELPAIVELCAGQSEVLVPGVAESFAWSNGTTESTLLVDTPGDYSAVLSNGECAIEVSTEVVVAELPEFDFPTIFELCEDSTLVQVLPDLPYTFSLDGEAILDSVRVESAGSYLLVALDPSSGCTSSRAFEVNGLMSPQALLPESITLCEQTSVVLDPGNEASGTSTLWNTGDETSLLTVFESGVYSVELENTCGSASAFTEVEVVACDCPVFVPNAFTPDLDDLNELFFPVIACDVTDYRFSIFDRWGSLLFYSETPGEGWNGEGPAGTHYVQGEAYVWQLQFRADLPGNAIVVDRVGHVTVLR